MARKRMFDNDIINQDEFLELPSEAKALYFLLGMEADDEGFVAPRRVLRLHNINNDNLKILIAKGYLIPFESGVVVITDWKRNNYLDKNKIKSTIYVDEIKLLNFDEEKQRYVLNVVIPTVKLELNQSLTEVKQKFTQYRVVENRVDENSIDENSSSSSVSENLYDSNVEEIQRVMIETIGTTNINNIMECVNYLDKLPVELIEYALRKTARVQHPSWQYTIPILESYIKKGFKTIEEVKADDLQHKNGGVKTNSAETDEEKMARKKRELEEALRDDRW